MPARRRRAGGGSGGSARLHLWSSVGVIPAECRTELGGGRILKSVAPGVATMIISCPRCEAKSRVRRQRLDDEPTCCSRGKALR